MIGRIPADSVPIADLEPPYDELVRGRKEGKDDASILQKAGYETWRVATLAASSIPASDNMLTFLDLLHNVASLKLVGSKLRRFSDKMLRGEEVDLSEVMQSLAMLEAHELEFITMDQVSPESVLWKPSWWPAIDDYIDGLPTYGLVLTAGSPGSGKTTAVIKMMHHITAHRQTVGLFTLEVTNEIIKKRWLDMYPDLSPKQAKRVYACDINYDLDEVCASITRLVAQVPDIYAVFIDFADLLSVQESTENASEIYVKLALLAKKLRITIVLLCQLSRAYASRGGGQPRVTDIRWSGLAEAMATLILLIYNPHQLFSAVDEESRSKSLPYIEGMGYIIEGKSRFGYKMGGPGAVRLPWNKAEGWGDEGDSWEVL